MIIEKSKIDIFIQTVRSISGLDACSPFSLEDIHYLAYRFGLDGLIYLEKYDDKRHVNVLFRIDKNSWAQYEQNGKLILDFIKHHNEFKLIYGQNVSNIVNFPAFQNNPNSSDCAPISLFIMSVCNSLYKKDQAGYARRGHINGGDAS